MSNPSKAKGTRAETKVVRFLEQHGVEASRQALAGSSDKGDIYIRKINTIIEVKAGKQTANPSRGQIEEWQRQAVAEAENAKACAVLVVVRYNRKLQDSDVFYHHDALGAWIHMYLDEYVGLLEE